MLYHKNVRSRIIRLSSDLELPLGVFCAGGQRGWGSWEVKMASWDKAAIQQMLQGVSGYKDVPRLALDVEEVVREFRSLQPKVDCLGML